MSLHQDYMKFSSQLVIVEQVRATNKQTDSEETMSLKS